MREAPLPDRIAGCMFGGACGDAFGAHVEGLSAARIRERFGGEGLTDRSHAEKRLDLSVSDETELALATARAVVRAFIRAHAKGIGGARLGMLQAEYAAWALGPDATGRKRPGRAVVEALEKARRVQPMITRPLGTVDEPVNDSKGSGAVVRTAPCGILAHTAENAFTAGVRAAALTHGHPGGYLPAGVVAALVCRLVRGDGLETAVRTAGEPLAEWEGSEETAAAVDAAVALAERGDGDPDRVAALGSGWTGPEALAIGLYAALVADRSWRRVREDPDAWPRPSRVGEQAVRIAVNHSGDSDATGAIAGALIGAAHGTHVLPGRWQVELDARGRLLRINADLALAAGPSVPTDPRFGGPPVAWSTGELG